MKPNTRSLKQRGRDHRFVAEIQSLLADPLRQRLADRVRSGEFVCFPGPVGELLFQHVLDGEFLYHYCERCGCTHGDPCEGGCAWVRPGLCTACLTNEEACERMGMKPCKRNRSKRRKRR